MKERLRRFLPGTLVLVCGLLSYWLVRDVSRAETKPALRETRVPAPVVVRQEPPKPSKSLVRDRFADGTTIELFSSCREEEIILRFPSNESYQSFIYALDRSQIRLIDRLDPLRALRLGWSADEKAELLTLFQDEQITTYKTLPHLPAAPLAPGGALKSSAVAFGSQTLRWLGVSGDHSRWGSGVKVAVLDSGVVAHPALPRVFRSIEIFPFPENPAETEGHGTAVASLVASIDPFAPGVAPAVDLISVRIIDERGTSDSFAVAAGILAAVDAGAEILNLSLGEEDDSPLAREAIRMAQDAGVVIVASSGNGGRQEAQYPAAYDGVISVGSVDACVERMSFSNLGSALSLTAPGYGVNAAAPGGRFVSISGTSASAPLVTGAIAATMSDGSGRRMSATEAAKIVLAYADDRGLPGPDAEYGCGVLNIGRIMNRNVRGLSDAAISSMRMVSSGETGNGDQIEVAVQNRGTEILTNTLVQITSPAGTTTINATGIAPCATQIFTTPFSRQSLPANQQASISCTVSLGNYAVDITPENNHRETVFVPR